MSNEGNVNVLSVFETPFPLFAPETRNDREVVDNVLRSIHQAPNPLNTAFFSRANVDAIQRDIQASVQAKSGYKIDRQSDEQLLIIMRSIYVNNADAGTAEPRQHLRYLNSLVVAECLPIVASNLKQYLFYLRDASRLPEPLERAKHTSMKGSNVTELFRGL